MRITAGAPAAPAGFGISNKREPKRRGEKEEKEEEEEKKSGRELGPGQLNRVYLIKRGLSVRWLVVLLVMDRD